MILHCMYNSGEKLTTTKASEMTGRSRNYCSRMLKKLTNLGFLEWYGNNKNDRNQYYQIIQK